RLVAPLAVAIEVVHTGDVGGHVLRASRRLAELAGAVVVPAIPVVERGHRLDGVAGGVAAEHQAPLVADVVRLAVLARRAGTAAATDAEDGPIVVDVHAIVA